MPDESKELPFNAITEARKSAKDEVEQIFPWMDDDEKNLEIGIRVLERVDKRQLTIEMATDFLRIKEKYFREQAEKEMADRPGSLGAELDYNTWSKIHDALNGAVGKGPVSATIGYFREEASKQRNTLERINDELSGQAPLQESKDKPMFEHIFLMSQNAPKREKAAENYDTAARLFENRIELKVT